MHWRYLRLIVLGVVNLRLGTLGALYSASRSKEGCWSGVRWIIKYDRGEGDSGILPGRLCYSGYDGRTSFSTVSGALDLTDVRPYRIEKRLVNFQPLC